jgi:outer membrane lipoprotein SlyB
MLLPKNKKVGEAAMQNGQPAKNGLRIITALVLACCAMLLSSCYWAFHLEGSQRTPKASVRKGAEVVVTLIQGSRRGELVGVEADGLVIAIESGMDSPWSQAHPDNRLTLAFSDIKSVRIIKKMRTVNAGLMGALVGIPMGVVAAKVVGHETDEMGAAIERGGLFLLGGMTAGAVAGIFLADALAKDETYVLKGQSKEEIEKILVQLKKRARIENDQ